MSTITLSPPTDTSSRRTSVPMLSISTSSSGGSNSARTLPPLKIPDLDLDSATSSSSAAAAVPFPRISQRRKLYRGVGTQPWHNKGSDSDSDSDSRKSKSKVASATAVSSHPNPETMPNYDPKRTYSESQITTPNPSLLSAIYGTPLIRKKSGEVVKSSLKSPKSPRNSSFGTSSGSFSSQGSMTPLTPTLKNSVHFDGQLEHVRLFHKEQKPAAVSREGSPRDTETSDNDALGQSDGVYRSSEDERMRSKLVLEAVNIPLRNAMASTQERLGDLDIRLEQVVLSKDGRAVEGTVLVRNIAFEKWIAVRFTYDWWQTTSEVTAKHSKSIPEENTDLFSFSIRLPEVTKRIEEKRLFFALRYLAAGREAWDNNRGENYQLRFRTERKVQAPVQRTSPTHPPSWPVKSANVDQMADLRKELERVVREDDESNGVPSWDVLTAKLRAKNVHIEEDRAAKKESNFGSRYDFGASSKVKWEPPKELPKYGGPPPETMAVPFPSLRPTHTKAASISGSPSLQTVSWRSPRGSPRDTGADSTANSPKFFIDPREAKHSAGTTRQRHHQRGGYFDSYMEGTSNAVLTPTTGEALEMTPSTSTSSTDTVTPAVLVTEDNNEVSSETESTSSSASSSADAAGEQAQSRPVVRFNSYPMDKTYLSPPITSSGSVSPSSGMQGSLVAPTSSPWALSPQGSLSSIGSTPSITSASSPSQSPSSPSELSDSVKSIHQLAPGANRPSLDSVDYSYFLTRFCYYTGHDNTDRHGLSASYGSPHHRRTQSESIMDGQSPSWDPTVSGGEVVINDATWTPSVRPQFESPDLDAGSWSGDSGHTTPTRSSTPKGVQNSPGKTTPRAQSPLPADVELTPRMPSTDYFVRPYRGSL